MAKRPCIRYRAPKQLTRTLGKCAGRGSLMKVAAPLSARVFEAIYFTSPFDSLPFALTSSTASSFHSSSVYISFTRKIPMATTEEKMTIRLMLPLKGFGESGVSETLDGGAGGTYGALMADFKTLRVPLTAGRMSTVCRRSAGGEPLQPIVEASSHLLGLRHRHGRGRRYAE